MLKNQNKMNISKQAVLDVLKNYRLDDLDTAQLTATINELPSISDGWISASERLPELVKDKEYSENVYAVIDGQLGIACLCYHWEEEGESNGFYWVNCNGSIDNDDSDWDDVCDVTEWQPLPTPTTRT